MERVLSYETAGMWIGVAQATDPRAPYVTVD